MEIAVAQEVVENNNKSNSCGEKGSIENMTN